MLSSSCNALHLNACSTKAHVFHVRQLRCFTVRAYNDIDVEPEVRAPDSAPGRWGASPPPPPPPPPPPAPKNALQPPSRREALFGFLGMGLGVGGMAAYYNSQYDLSDASAEKALDALFADPDFLDTLEEEVLYRRYGKDLDQYEEEVDGLVEIDKQLKELQEELQQAAAAAGVSTEEGPAKK